MKVKVIYVAAVIAVALPAAGCSTGDRGQPRIAPTMPSGSVAASPSAGPDTGFDCASLSVIVNDALLRDAEASLESTRRGVDNEWYTGQVRAYYGVLATALRNQAAETEDPTLRTKIESWASRAGAAASAVPGTRLDATLVTEISRELEDACPPSGPIMPSLNASNLQPFDPTRIP